MLSWNLKNIPFLPGVPRICRKRDGAEPLGQSIELRADQWHGEEVRTVKLIYNKTQKLHNLVNFAFTAKEARNR